MTGSLERLWTSFMDSSGFRWFVKRSFAARFFRSDAYQKMNIARRWLLTSLRVRQNPDLFSDVKTLCMFIGHNKSGASMLGAMLDAHPKAVFSDEANILQYIPAGFSREQIFHLLLKNSRREKMKGRVTARRLGGYSWEVPGQWQGRFSRLEVIGDSTSGTSTRTLGNTPALLDTLRVTLGEIRLKFIFVIRNPFDPISLIMIRGNRSFENAIAHYFSNCDLMTKLHGMIPAEDILPVRYETFVTEPITQLTRIADHLGLEAEQEYLEACASVMHPTPEQSRHQVEWSEAWVRAVEEKIKTFNFLDGYSFRD